MHRVNQKMRTFTDFVKEIKGVCISCEETMYKAMIQKAYWVEINPDRKEDGKTASKVLPHV